MLNGFNSFLLRGNSSILKSALRVQETVIEAYPNNTDAFCHLMSDLHKPEFLQILAYGARIANPAEQMVCAWGTFGAGVRRVEGCWRRCCWQGRRKESGVGRGQSDSVLKTGSILVIVVIVGI